MLRLLFEKIDLRTGAGGGAVRAVSGGVESECSIRDDL
jgi:hypothetical protein